MTVRGRRYGADRYDGPGTPATEVAMGTTHADDNR